MWLDHIAVSAETLEEATEHCEATLGVSLLPGGQHPKFATHNCLLGLADGLYLEAIAVDKNAATPDRPRWFDLDRFAGPARLTNWICACANLEEALSSLTGDLGQPLALTRGDLRWRMAVPDTGVLPFDNLHPALIEWQSTLHTSER